MSDSFTIFAVIFTYKYIHAYGCRINILQMFVHKISIFTKHILNFLNKFSLKHNKFVSV